MHSNSKGTVIAYILQIYEVQRYVILCSQTCFSPHPSILQPLEESCCVDNRVKKQFPPIHPYSSPWKRVAVLITESRSKYICSKINSVFGAAGSGLQQQQNSNPCRCSTEKTLEVFEVSFCGTLQSWTSLQDNG